MRFNTYNINPEIDYYKILDVKKGATKQDIKKAFYKLVKIHHPDHGGSSKKI